MAMKRAAPGDKKKQVSEKPGKPPMRPPTKGGAKTPGKLVPPLAQPKKKF